jgi:phenylacetaldehyde dehydrogenase
VSLELGSKSPAIILPDADLDLAIAGAASAIFFNHGQCCCAGSRLYAHKSVYDRVVAGVSEIAGKIKVGPGLDPATEMGPLVSNEQFARVTGYIEDGRQSGASIAVGGRPRRQSRLFRRADRVRTYKARHENRHRGDLRAGGLRPAL